MNWLNVLLSKVGQLFNWFYVVVPWDRAMRVRWGKHMKVMGPGVHVQIPFLDKVYIMGIRDRVASTTTQTLTTANGVTITLCAGFRFEIVDIEPMYNRLHNAGETISQEIEGSISDYIITHNEDECTPAHIKEHVLDKVDLSEYGLNCTKVFFTDFVKVRTYRLINGGMDRWSEPGVNTSHERKGGMQIGVY